MSDSTDNQLSKRLSKILEAKLENDKETLEALKYLSTFFTENTLQTRRNLRSQIEQRSLAIHESFLSQFQEVKSALDDVYSDVLALNESIKGMSAQLQKTKSQTKSLIAQTNHYQNESKKIEMQQIVIAAFLKNLQLSQSELEALHGATRDAPMTLSIFPALDKVHTIHSNCKILMQAGYQTLAVEIMEQMTLHQEGALERLYRWTQSHCRNVETPEVGEIVTQAMARLQDRPVLFKYIIDEYCTSRRAILVGKFIDALTRGGPNNDPPPIEHTSHDPQKYVGDMLAWLDRTVPVEKENLFVLVNLCDKTDISEQLTQALANISEGLCPPLRVRIDKILALPTPAITLYAVMNLIRFYNNSLAKIVKDGLLAVTLGELLQLSEKVFLDSLQRQVATALVRVESPPRDLSPTPSVHSLLKMLREVLSAASLVEDKETDMNKIASCFLDPLFCAVNEQASRLPPTDMAVYLLNCLYAMQTCLSLYEYMDNRLERLEAQSEAQIDTLTSEQASSLVANLSLGPVYTILQDQGKGPLSSIPGMEPSSLRNFLSRLDSLAVMPDMVLLPQITLLSSSKHRKAVQKRAFDVLIAIYKQLYEGVHNPANLYQNPAAILNRTPDELAKMFSF